MKSWHRWLGHPAACRRLYNDCLFGLVCRGCDYGNEDYDDDNEDYDDDNDGFDDGEWW